MFHRKGSSTTQMVWTYTDYNAQLMSRKVKTLQH